MAWQAYFRYIKDIPVERAQIDSNGEEWPVFDTLEEAIEYAVRDPEDGINAARIEADAGTISCTEFVTSSHHRGDYVYNIDVPTDTLTILRKV